MSKFFLKNKTTKIILLCIPVLILLTTSIALLAFFFGNASATYSHNSLTLWDAVQGWRRNTHRVEYVKSDLLCEFASVRAYQINTDYSHAGFEKQSVYKTHIFDGGYTKLVENIGQFYVGNSTLDAWLKSPKHLEAMEGPYTDACVVCVDKFCALEMGSK